MSLENRSGLNHQISEEAAGWLIELRTGDIDTAGRRAFDLWVRSSPEHLRAFIEMAALWNASSAVDARRRLDVETIMAPAGDEIKVIGLRSEFSGGADVARLAFPERDSLASEPADAPRGKGVKGGGVGRIARLAVAASLIVAAAGGALTLGSRFLGPPTYRTQVGEQRSIRLADGSIMVLDSRSRLRVAFTPNIRKVELLAGQALFDVTRNPQKPFVVLAGETVVRDVGTQFNVNRGRDGTLVTVVEGQVSVSRSDDGASESARPAAAPAAGRADLADDEVPKTNRPNFLSAGEQVDMPAYGFSLQPVEVNVSSVMAWTHRQVVLNSATLAQAADVFNRYSTRKLVTEDRGLKPLRLSGVFDTDPDFLIRYLSARPDISVTETDSEIDIVRRSAP